MSRKFKQYIYYPNNSSSIPSDLIISGRIKRLGVQSIPGLKLNIDNEDIIIGYPGILDIDLTNSSAVINQVKIDENSYNNLIIGNSSGYLIIDIMIEEGDV